jgi:hypothetical protein
MDKLLHLKFWFWLGTAGTAIGGGLFMGLFAEDSAEAAWGEPAPEIAITYERLSGYKILAIAGIMVPVVSSPRVEISRSSLRPLEASCGSSSSAMPSMATLEGMSRRGRNTFPR